MIRLQNVPKPLCASFVWEIGCNTRKCDIMFDHVCRVDAIF